MILCSPSDEDALGRSMASSDLITGLRRANPSIIVPTGEEGTWFPHPTMSAIWLGKPFAEGSRKLCALHLGSLPEFTQRDPDGRIITRGWRDIMRKVVKAGAASQAKLERIFRVSLSFEGDPTLCQMCLKEGKGRIAHNGGKRRLCDFHEPAVEAAFKAKYENGENRSRLTWKPGKVMI